MTNDGFIGFMRIHGQASTNAIEVNTAFSSQTKSIVPLHDSMFASPTGASATPKSPQDIYRYEL